MIDLAEYIAMMGVKKVAEVGIGNHFAISRRLEESGIQVVKTDLKKTADDVIADDVCNPDLSKYEGVELIYSIRPPYEIQACILRLGSALKCDVIILPLKNEIVEGGRLVNYRSARFYIFTPRDSQEMPGHWQTP
ncbi:UPF0146 family protein [Geoglobus acetivorans]|uniref:UPF0146 protein GACE_1630 n=1 Tax=Geoglobus acetivorans TaxID=565033 RepID=A0A0A7GFM8_GEOAI|nr:hypothetical protein GACE_1630 [Geoglobus acetivorans]